MIETRARRGAYRLILCATDGSRQARAAGEQAIALAQATGARLLGLYVVDDFAVGYAGVFRNDVREALRAEGRRVLAALAQAAREGGVAFQSLLAEGIPKRKVVEVARAQGADLLVLGLHERPWLLDLLMGGVAGSVVRRAPCDVLVVHSPAGEAAAVGRPPEARWGQARVLSFPTART